MATRMFDRRPAAALADPHERVATIVARHGDLLLRVARQFSLCADDAHDAVQRALEIYMRRVDSLDPATELAWLKVVVKHEALAVRRGRAGVAGEEVDLDAVPAVGAAVGRGALRVQRARRALRRGHAAAEARRGAGADAQGRGPLLQRDRRAARLDLYEGKSLHYGGSEALHAPLRGARDGRRVRAARADAARARARHRRAATRCSSSARTCATAPAAARRSAPCTRRACSRLTAFAPIAALIEPARAWVERLRGGGGRRGAAGRRAASDRAPAGRRGADAPAQQRRAGRAVRRARGGREREPPLDRPDQPPRLARARTPAPPELRPRDRRPRGDAPAAAAASRRSPP